MSGTEQLLGQKLQAARLAKNITQQQLCQRVDLSYSTLTKIERGAIKTPSVFTVAKICAVLGVSLDDLMGAVVQGYSTQPNHPAEHSNQKVSKTGVRFLYMDVNNCLVHFTQMAFHKIAEDYGLSSGQVESAFWHYNEAANRGKMSIDKFNQKFAARLGVKNLRWEDYYLDATQAIKPAQDVLIWASKHYKIGLLSNHTDTLIEGLLAKGTLPDLEYDAIIDSSKTGFIKPEPEIYQLALQVADVRPEEILFVDDSRENLIAAESLGWQVLWFDDFYAQQSAANVRNALEF